MTNILEIDSVILEFDSRRVLQDIYFKSETGKISGLLGLNGSGKSCLMKIIYGELKTNNKSIRINGVSVIDGFRNPETMRYLPQFEFIPKLLTVKRIFRDFGLVFSDFVCEFPEFEKYHNSNFKSLSSGEQRIVEIYSILASKTQFCMLDEPFSQVMPLHIETIKKLIVKEKENKGIIVTDHLYQHIIDICDNLYVISNGKTYLTKSLHDLETLGYTNKLYGIDSTHPLNQV